MQEERRQINQLKKERNRRIKVTYYIFAGLFLLLSVGVLAKILYINAVERDKWLSYGKYFELGEKRINPLRGTIYSASDTPLAVTYPRYRVSLDFKANGFKDSVFIANLDSMAYNLSKIVGVWSKQKYKVQLKNDYLQSKKTKSRTWVIVPREITRSEKDALMNTAYFNIRNGNISGLIYEEVIRRKKPYGSLASRTIGNLRPDLDSLGLTHGSSGLELKYDSLLCGSSGTYLKKRVSGLWVYKELKKMQKASNIYTTIDVNIQDITERALLKAVETYSAAWGTAVVMKVHTGEIVAMSNLDRRKNGNYAEITNHALKDLIEPGSTIKPVSILACLEDGLCHPDDPVDVGNGVMPYLRRSIRDHNANRGGYGLIDVKKSIWFSSNIGVAKVVMKAYKNNPEAFRERIVKMGFLDPINLEIPGTAKPRYKEVSQWSTYTLPWISYGYESQIPPIYTLRFYNGIANGGKMLEPYLVRKITQDGEIISETKPKIVREQMAKKKQIEEIKEMLRGVVLHGTAKVIADSKVPIAGKTGTAMLPGLGGYSVSQKNLTFCGFFPYDNPKYTAIVVVSRPVGGHSGPVCGTAVAEIANQIQATMMYKGLSEVHADSLETNRMSIRGGRADALRYAYKRLMKRDYLDPPKRSPQWLVYQSDSLGYKHVKPVAVTEGVVPNLKGLMPMDACYLAGTVGLSVQIKGNGSVVTNQSLSPGHKVRNGEQIILTLNN